jgi:hypothetical protein
MGFVVVSVIPKIPPLAKLITTIFIVLDAALTAMYLTRLKYLKK